MAGCCYRLYGIALRVSLHRFPLEFPTKGGSSVLVPHLFTQQLMINF